jgi:hypothetical protein
MDIANHADNFADSRLARIVRSVWRDPFANRILTGEILFRETFSYNRDRRRISVVAVGECAA